KLMSQRNRVYSLVQNVTVEVYSKDKYRYLSRKLRRPRFSFFSSSIVKEQTSKTSQNLFPSTPGKPRTSNQHRSQFFRKHQSERLRR
ncbi:hypothetical protein, partial [Rhizobium rhizogenes]|uniref:hypothetical protein n=2 Tax=Rhizobium rhizogenes TaxID=359 RepID=UPI001AEBF194